MSDYRYWQEAIKITGGRRGLTKDEMRQLGVHDGRPCLGFYRKRDGKDGPLLPAAIFWHGGKDENGEPDGDEKLVCVLGVEDDVETRDAEAEWTWLAHHPVTEEAYRQAYATGKWPDDAPDAPRRVVQVAPSLMPTAAPAAPAPGIGHNLPTSDDPAEALREELAGEAEIVAEMLATDITTQEQADRVGPWAKRIGEIKARAVAAHKLAKQPWLDGGRKVDAAYKPLIEEAENLVAKLKQHTKPYLDKKDAEEKERQRKAEEEARRLREEAAKVVATAEAEDAAAQAKAAELTQRATEAARAAAPKPINVGRTGAKVSLRREKVAVVKDYKAAANHLLDLNHSEIKEKIDQLAQRALKNSGITLAGVEVEEVTKAA